MHYTSVTILYNPQSTGPSQRNAERLSKRLSKSGYSNAIRILPTEYAGHAEQLAYEHAKKGESPLIISSSGDGGYNEVLNGVMRAQSEGFVATTGLLPSGNANDHHKELHDHDILKQIVQGTTKKIDVLCISAKNGKKPWKRYAHSYIGFGLTPEISVELNKADLNKANEIIISLRGLAKVQPFSIIQGNVSHEYHSIVISNVSKMSKFFALSKTSTIDDGKFEVFAIEPNRAKLIGTLVKSATIGVPHTAQTDSYEFKTVSRLPVQLDGEVAKIDAHSMVTISIEPQALTCVI